MEIAGIGVNTPMLDNPIWSALVTKQAHFALGEGRARRYPADMAPFIAIGEAGREDVAAMRGLVSPGETLYLLGVVPDALPGWTVESVSSVSQMVYDGRVGPPESDEGIAVLGSDDVPDMLGLTALVYPGYFRPRTIEMGTYLGIRHGGRLVAMAGQRLCLEGYREISGVCTHPDFRGQGHARRLVARLVDQIILEGLKPFLHVDADNSAARAAYEKVGFVWRRDLTLLRANIQAQANSSG